MSEEVANALEDGMPLVALESSVIAQGLPRPVNLEAALHVEEAVRTAGAVPATLAVLDGRISVGLGRTQLERLARQQGISKAGARDLAWAVSTGASMATTVGSSIAISAAAGIHVLATGGVGGA
ncbi:MAG TPA: pseudouridine-5'-phosphate glycosidase, partial [Chloroflexota bacterium]|nr:pseudouridine-5'-phosphate glycosidase [Chloroflexota bacterium]